MEEYSEIFALGESLDFQNIHLKMFYDLELRSCYRLTSKSRPPRPTTRFTTRFTSGLWPSRCKNISLDLAETNPGEPALVPVALSSLQLPFSALYIIIQTLNGVHLVSLLPNSRTRSSFLLYTRIALLHTQSNLGSIIGSLAVPLVQQSCLLFCRSASPWNIPKVPTESKVASNSY